MNKNKDTAFYLEADIEVVKETDELRKTVASIIPLPDSKNKQPDLLYFSAIFVSSGENLNHAVFMPSELIKAEGTILNKALDIEHKEEEIIGHLYQRAYTDLDGNLIDINDLSGLESASVDKNSMHIVIAGIIYKSRFPKIAEEVASGKWKVSMECYYQDFDIKIGDLILSKKEAEALGLITVKDTAFVGKAAKVIKNGIEIASGTVAKVLRNILFSGCGIVQNPANPPSVVLETANKIDKEASTDKDTIILNYDKNLENTSNNVTSKDIEGNNNKLESAELEHNDTVGICVSYKKEIIDATFKGPGTNVLKKDWCALYDKGCTSFSRDTTDIDCLRNKVSAEIDKVIRELMHKSSYKDFRIELIKDLSKSINKAKKLIK